MAVSENRHLEFQRFLLSTRVKLNSAEDRFKLVPLAGEIPGVPRRPAPKAASHDVLRVVAWSPMGRAADVAILVDALSQARNHRMTRVTIDVIDVDGVPDALRAVIDPRDLEVRWLAHATDARLERVFDEADFAVVPGGPLALSRLAACLWRGIPCVVGVDQGDRLDQLPPGVMATNLRDEQTLAYDLGQMMEPMWRRTLAHEATRRRVKSWTEYAMELMAELAADRPVDGVHAIGPAMHRDVYSSMINLERRPRLSLCISTYNRAGWVGLNLKNIFAQLPEPRGDLEVLVVDNTSTDNTPEVVKPYLNRPDFRYVRNARNVGMLGNLAVTAQRARGEYVWILGDDDLTRPGAIDRVLDVIRRHPGIGLVYVNYGYTTEPSAANVIDLDAFLAAYNILEPAGPDEEAPVKRLAAKCENFFTAIYSHVYRRDHALRAYGQDTSGRIFSTMLSCIPNAYYVLNYMADEPAYWIGEPLLVVNSNVSWQDYGVLFDLEQLPRTWDLAERMGTDAAEVDRRRANRLWLVEMMWKEILAGDKVGNSAYFSAPRVLMRLKHLPELDKHIPAFVAAYEAARQAGHPAARMATEVLFSAFPAALPLEQGAPAAREAAE